MSLLPAWRVACADPFERVRTLRELQDGWEPGHRGISASVADRTTALVQALDGVDVFLSPFDGAILVMRLWPDQSYETGREVEILPDERMALLGDVDSDDWTVDDGDGDQPFDVDAAAAWLRQETR